MPTAFTVQHFSELPSTNDKVKEIAAACPHGTVVVADCQTAGRGRFSRQFFSPDKDGLYMSVLLKEGLSPDTVGLLTCAAAVATARAIERFITLPVHIKWVNDLLINNKKVCGILTEAAVRADGNYDFAVVGIGINVSTAAFPSELADIASSIQKECGQAPDTTALGTAVLEEFQIVLNSLSNRTFLEEYRNRCIVLGKQITVHRGNETCTAVALNVDENGGLIVQTGNGTHIICSGEVSVRL